MALYDNDFDIDNFDLRVSVLGIGQGSCNMIEIYNGQKLEFLAVIDFGTSSDKFYADTKKVISSIIRRMKQRANDSGTDDYYAFMDLFILTHQDADHQNQLDPLIEELDNNSNGKIKYIKEMYLGGNDYRERISNQLKSNGSIGKSVENMYHISTENIHNFTSFENQAELLCSPPRNAKINVKIEWMFSCLEANSGFPNSPPLNTVDSGNDFTFPSSNKFSSAHTRNNSSAIICMIVECPDEMGNSQSFIYYFPGDAERKTFEMFNNTGIKKPDGTVPVLFLMPHHGSLKTAKGRGHNLDDMERFIQNLCGEEKIWNVIASSAVCLFRTAHSIHHPSYKVVQLFEKYTKSITPPQKYSFVSLFHDYISKEVWTRIKDRNINTTEYIRNGKGTCILSELDFSTRTKFILTRRNFLIHFEHGRITTSMGERYYVMYTKRRQV